MELSYVLSWMVGAGALTGALRSLPQARQSVRGWFYVYSALLVVVLLGAYFDVPAAGFFDAALWLSFVVLPSRLMTVQSASLSAMDHGAARKATRFIVWLHPFDGQWQQRALLESLAWEEVGEFERAKAALTSLRSRQPWSDIAELEVLRLDGEWQKIVAHLEQRPVGSRSLALAPQYLTALGETSALPALWALYAQLPAPYAAQPYLRLIVHAYTGQVAVVRGLLKRHFPRMPLSSQTLWLATAELVSGERDSATRRLRELVDGRLPGHGRAARRLRVLLPTIDWSTLPPLTLALIDAQTRRDKLELLAKVDDAQVRRAPKPLATIALLGVQSAVFILSISGGTEEVSNLVRMGALVLPPELSTRTLAWQLVAAGFLHFGMTHWLMNSLGIWMLGRQVERLWRWWGLTCIFLLASIGSFALAALTIHSSLEEPRVFLGASAGVMGLVGALGTLFLYGYFRHKNRLLGRKAMHVLFVLAMQLTFDAFTPQVSSRIHLSGFLIGAIVAIPFAVASFRRSSLAMD